MILPKKCYINTFSKYASKQTDSFRFLDYMGFKSIVENNQDTYEAQLPEGWQSVEDANHHNWHTMYDDKHVARFSYFMNPHLSKIHIDLPQPSYVFSPARNIIAQVKEFVQDNNLSQDSKNEAKISEALIWLKDIFAYSIEVGKTHYPLDIAWSPEQIVAVFYEFLAMAEIDRKFILPLIRKIIVPSETMEIDFTELCISYVYAYLAIQQRPDDVALIDTYFEFYDFSYQTYMKKWYK